MRIRRRIRALVLAMAAGVVLTACVHTKAVMVNPSAAPLAPVAPETVTIYTSATELDTLEFVRVAIIEATGSGEFTSQSGMLEAMRKKAAALGANGILLPEIKEPGAGAKVAAAVFKTGTERKGSVVAIRVTGRKTR